MSALAALAIGAWLLAAGNKGRRIHKIVGYIWVANMALAAGSSFFITGIRLIGPFSPIHVLSVYAVWALLTAIWHARRGHIRAHRGIMRGLYFGGVLVAFTLSFLPGRIMNRALFAGVGEEAGFSLVVAMALIGVGIYLARDQLRRRA